MSIASRINEMTEHLRNDWDSINKLGLDITEENSNDNLDKNIKNIAPVLDRFYNKSSDKTDLAKNGVVGRTSQDGDPTPENPVEINNLSGDVEYRVRGKNLFNKGNYIELNGTPNTSGTFTGGGANYNIVIPCQPNTTYTIQKRNDGNTNRFAFFCSETIPSDADSAQTRILNGVRNDTASEITITTASTAKYLIAHYYRNVETALTKQQLLDSIQIEEGNQATPYEPYISESFPLSLKSKNLFDESLMTSIGGTIKYIPINVKKDTDYTLSTNSGTSTLANVFLSTTNSGVTTNNNGAMIGQPRTINSGDNNIMYVGYRSDLSPYWVQLEESSTPSDYEPYYDIELCKIGDYKDYFYKNIPGASDYSSDRDEGAWYLKKEVGKFNMTELSSKFGTVTQYQSNFNATNGIISLRLSKVYFAGYNIKEFTNGYFRWGYCNRFTNALNNMWNKVSQLNTFGMTDGIIIGMLYTDLGMESWSTTINDLSTKLNTYFGDTVFYLPLATPTTTEITQENYPTLYSQLLAIQEFLTKYKINKEFLLDYSSPEIKY